MKYKTIEKLPLKKYKGKSKKHIDMQTTGEYIVMDIWHDGEWTYRHAMHIRTGEYATYYVDKHTWRALCFLTILNGSAYLWSRHKINHYSMDEKIPSLINEIIGEKYPGGFDLIESMERGYNRDKRDRSENSRIRRINNMMGGIPAPGDAVSKWIADMMVGTLEYAFLTRKKGTYHCTACRNDFAEAATGIRMKHGKEALCPCCGRVLKVDKKRAGAEYKDWLMLIHDVDEQKGIVRFFNVTVSFNTGRVVRLQERIRWMLLRGDSKYQVKYYYESHGCWDTKNPMIHRESKCYLYPGMIDSGLKGTVVEHRIGALLPQMAAGGFKTEYARLLTEENEDKIRTEEYMYKGHFFRLLDEIVCNPWCISSLDYSGESIQQVMGIQDRQKINRLRDKNGGMIMLGWLQWSDAQGRKLSDAVLEWYQKFKISADYYMKIGCEKYLSPEQLMNYLERQRRDGNGKSAVGTLLCTYSDYISMAKKLGKNLDDEMVHRPRELKRRHDELVKEFELRREEMKIIADRERAEEEARRMEEKYPGAESILEEIRHKYEYSDETYRIMVPRNFFEITREGMALHHCVGHTERYFDRILQRETYICFLRRQQEPEKPYYTIEVEPGGTIRQHRGMYDEEPEIDEVKPFLRKWQKEIRRRMSKADHEYAKASAVKREQNMEELRRKNNTRVLEGLMEDLMEVI